MLSEDITLENMLHLALGSPELGAVNFNYLHEVISEILKHLGTYIMIHKGSDNCFHNFKKNKISILRILNLFTPRASRN